MLNEISHIIKQHLTSFPDDDTIIFNNHHYSINQDNFSTLTPQTGKSIAFVDGGQAEILSAANFSLSFIRVAAVIFKEKRETIVKEFFLLTTAEYQDNEIYYTSKLFGDQLINQQDLFISSTDNSIRNGNERAPISKIANMARRFAELSLATTTQADFILLDGTLEPTFKHETVYLDKLPQNTAALAKSSSLFTTSGNTPTILLNKLNSNNYWQYTLNETTSFVKLHPHTKHIFRFEGTKEILPYLIQNSKDALFLGYPYGLIAVDKVARVSNEEKKSLIARFLLNENNKTISEYLATSNAHDILDTIA